MRYIVTRDTYITEIDLELLEGWALEDGDLEPDLTAQLQSSGVLVPEGAAPLVEVSAPVADADDLSDEGDES